MVVHHSHSKVQSEDIHCAPMAMVGQRHLLSIGHRMEWLRKCKGLLYYTLKGFGHICAHAFSSLANDIATVHTLQFID